LKEISFHVFIFQNIHNGFLKFKFCAGTLILNFFENPEKILSEVLSVFFHSRNLIESVQQRFFYDPRKLNLNSKWITPN
jgi:hypothetical protein